MEVFFFFASSGCFPVFEKHVFILTTAKTHLRSLEKWLCMSEPRGPERLHGKTHRKQARLSNLARSSRLFGLCEASVAVWKATNLQRKRQSLWNSPGKRVSGLFWGSARVDTMSFANYCTWTWNHGNRGRLQVRFAASVHTCDVTSSPHCAQGCMRLKQTRSYFITCRHLKQVTFVISKWKCFQRE